MSFFSIIMPVYNKENQILNTVKSVLQQDFKDFELLVIDDGSTDQSLNLIEKFSDSRIRLFRQSNQGASAARNTGILHAQSDYLAFIDADDYWYPNHLETLRQLIIDFPNAGLFCSKCRIQRSKNNTLSPQPENIASEYRGYVSDFFISSIKTPVALTSSVAVPKWVFRSVAWFNPDISSGQDIDLWIRIALQHPVAISNQFTALYHFEVPNSLSKTRITEKRLLDFSVFKDQEAANNSLKKFLDFYRVNYALHFLMFNCKASSKAYLSEVNPLHIARTTQFLLRLPPWVLRWLFKVKDGLKKNGIEINIYR